MKIRRLSYLFFGHMTSDLYPGMLSPLLPLLLARYDLSMATAGILVMVLQAFSNLGQPLVGILNDYRPMKSFLWIGLLVSALPFSFLLSYHSVSWMIVALAVCGIGVSIYHPVAVVAAGIIAKEDKRSGLMMAIFSSGGSFGFMIAPLIIVLIVKYLGDHYFPLIMIPALVMTFLFITDRRVAVCDCQHQSLDEWFVTLRESRRELFLLWMVSSFRAIVSLNLSSFLPILTIARGASYAASAYFLSASLLASMIGMFLGGYLSDKHGRRKIMAITLLLSSPLLLAFQFTTGPFSLVMLLLGTAALSSTIPVNIMLAQRAAPKHASIASSFVMGLPFAVAALVAPMIGALADRITIIPTMTIIFFVPLLGGVTVFALKQD